MPESSILFYCNKEVEISCYKYCLSTLTWGFLWNCHRQSLFKIETFKFPVYRYQKFLMPNTSLFYASCTKNPNMLKWTVYTVIHWRTNEEKFFCMLRNTRSKLMRIIYRLRSWLNSKFLFFDTFLNRQTNLKSMFSALSAK
jgi:hypothetical protein